MTPTVVQGWIQLLTSQIELKILKVCVSLTSLRKSSGSVVSYYVAQNWEEENSFKINDCEFPVMCDISEQCFSLFFPLPTHSGNTIHPAAPEDIFMKTHEVSQYHKADVHEKWLHLENTIPRQRMNV